MQSMKSLYKPCLYPLVSGQVTDKSSVLSLVDCVCLSLVKDSTLTQLTIKEVPKELCYNLLRAALLLSRDRAIEVIIAHWPYKVLSLQRFAPPFNELAMLYSDSYTEEMVRRAVKFTTCIAHAFVECLKKRTPTRLQCLDLTGYPTAEVIVNYLSSHVMLVHNEQRQREIISIYNQVTQNLPDDQRQQYQLESTLPDNSYIIQLDMHIETKEAHMEICKALKKIKECSNPMFKFSVNTLDVTALNVAHVTVLLDQIERNSLQGLSLRYIGLSRESLEVLLPSLSSLTQLTSLDMSCNGLNIPGQSALINLMVQALSSLPCLIRLDLSNNRTKFQLRPILSAIYKPLQYLRLCACGIGIMDLNYLRHSHHVEALTELDLSENNLYGSKANALADLLRELGPRLTVLELEDCTFSRDDFITIFASTTHLTALRYLNICRNESLGTNEIFDGLALHLLKMENLQACKMSYPVECYISQDFDQVEPIKHLLSEHISQLTQTYSQREGRPRLHVELTG